MIITFYFCVLQVMASGEGTFPGPHCKNANISIEGLMGSDICKLSCCDFSKGILYELNQLVQSISILWVNTAEI